MATERKLACNYYNSVLAQHVVQYNLSFCVQSHKPCIARSLIILEKCEILIVMKVNELNDSDDKIFTILLQISTNMQKNLKK